MELPKSISIKDLNKPQIPEKLKNYITVKFLYFIFGLLVSRNVIFENYSPFGAALISSVPYQNLWPALVGTILGYFLPNKTIFSIRYIATVLAIQAIRWTFNDLIKLKEHI